MHLSKSDSLGFLALQLSCEWSNVSKQGSYGRLMQTQGLKAYTYAMVSENLGTVSHKGTTTKHRNEHTEEMSFLHIWG